MATPPAAEAGCATIAEHLIAMSFEIPHNPTHGLFSRAVGLLVSMALFIRATIALASLQRP